MHLTVDRFWFLNFYDAPFILDSHLKFLCFFMTNLLRDFENLREVWQLCPWFSSFNVFLVSGLQECPVGIVNASPGSIYTLSRVSWRNANPEKIKIGELRKHWQTFLEILRISLMVLGLARNISKLKQTVFNWWSNVIIWKPEMVPI
jgi:hypothetical protein